MMIDTKRHFAPRRVIGFLSVFILLSYALKAQEVKKVKGEATLRIEKNMSFNVARSLVLEQAKKEALAQEFGTQIVEGNTSRVKNIQTTGKVQTTSHFESVSESFVNGEWLGESKPPRFREYYKDGYQWISCTVWGKARRLDKVKTDLTLKTLRCLDLKCENTRFVEGDDFFVFFQTPVNGYVSIYLDDGENVQCLLPYSQMKESFIAVEPDRPYYFFSSRHDYLGNPYLVDEYVLSAESELDLNRLYLIFSKVPFDKASVQKAKASLEDDGQVWELPKSLSTDAFKKWLLLNRSKDSQMQVEIVDLTITKP